jgi:hypothetical protein
VDPVAGRRDDLAFDVGDDPPGLVLVAVDEQPPRALGHVPADQQDGDAEEGAGPPADRLRRAHPPRRHRGGGGGMGNIEEITLTYVVVRPAPEPS